MPGTNTLIFADNSFTKTSLDEYDGQYYHTLSQPGDTLWQFIDTDVDPWMDEVFTTGLFSLHSLYGSCPSHYTYLTCSTIY